MRYCYMFFDPETARDRSNLIGPGWSRPKGEVSVVGVLKSAEKRSTFSPENKPETRQLLWAEKASLLQAAGLIVHDPLETGVNSVPILMEAVGESGGTAVFFCPDK